MFVASAGGWLKLDLPPGSSPGTFSLALFTVEWPDALVGGFEPVAAVGVLVDGLLVAPFVVPFVVLFPVRFVAVGLELLPFAVISMQLAIFFGTMERTRSKTSAQVKQKMILSD